MLRVCMSTCVCMWAHFFLLLGASILDKKALQCLLCETGRVKLHLWISEILGGSLALFLNCLKQILDPMGHETPRLLLLGQNWPFPFLTPGDSFEISCGRILDPTLGLPPLAHLLGFEVVGYNSVLHVSLECFHIYSINFLWAYLHRD